MVLCPGQPADLEGINEVLADRFEKWQLPDDILFVDELPHTATGKGSKLNLRKQIAASGYALAS